MQIYGIEGQADVFLAQLKRVRRKKWNSLTELAMEIRQLMVMALPGSTDRTMEIVARDVFIDASDDHELTSRSACRRRPIWIRLSNQRSTWRPSCVSSLAGRANPFERWCMEVTKAKSMPNGRMCRQDRGIYWIPVSSSVSA